MNKKKICICIITILFIAVIIGVCFMQKPKSKNLDIITYEIQTSEYFGDNKIDEDQFVIDSKKELDIFYKIYSNKANINADYLKDNYIFIKTIQVGSGSIPFDLKEVNFKNNTLNFVIDSTYPEVGTADMAFWYIIAIVPKDKLKGINISNWKKPSDIIND